MNRILILSCIALGISFATLVFVLTRPTAHADNTTIEVTVTEVEPEAIEEPVQFGIVNKEIFPKWEDNTIVYKINDREDKYSDKFAREWTPYYNKDMRCVAAPEGVFCFPAGETSPITR
jgi:hypothetical protein